MSERDKDKELGSSANGLQPPAEADRLIEDPSSDNNEDKGEAGRRDFYWLMVPAVLLILMLVAVLFIDIFPTDFLRKSWPEQPANKQVVTNHPPSYSPSLVERSEELAKEMSDIGELPPLDSDYLEEYLGRKSLEDYRIWLSYPQANKYLLDLAHFIGEKNDLVFDLSLVVDIFDDRFEFKRFDASSLPARTMLFGSTIVLYLENEALLAGVVSHELAHIKLRHGAKRKILTHNFFKKRHLFLKAHWGRDSAALNLAWEKTLGWSDPFLGSSGFGSWSESVEDEADALAQQFLLKAGYDPRALNNFFSIILKEPSNFSRGTIESIHHRVFVMEERAKTMNAEGLPQTDFVLYEKKQWLGLQAGFKKYLKELDEKDLASLIKKS